MKDTNTKLHVCECNEKTIKSICPRCGKPTKPISDEEMLKTIEASLQDVINLLKTGELK